MQKFIAKIGVLSILLTQTIPVSAFEWDGDIQSGDPIKASYFKELRNAVNYLEEKLNLLSNDDSGEYNFVPRENCEYLVGLKTPTNERWTVAGTTSYSGTISATWACFENAFQHTESVTKTWALANAEVQAWGGILPSRQELETTDGQGNGWDAASLWTRESCGANSHYIFNRNGANVAGTSTCVADSTSQRYTGFAYYKNSAREVTDATIAGNTATVEVSPNIKTGGNWLSNDGDDEGIFVDTAGKVGIGSATPTQVLDVTGATRLNGNVGIGVAPRTDSYKLALGGAVYAGNTDINYVNQLHFNANVRFYDDTADNYLNFKYGDTATGGIKFYDGDTTLQGYVYADGNGTNPSFGLLDGDGNWGVRIRKDDHTSFWVNNSEKMRITSGGSVGIGNTAPSQKLDVTGTVKATEFVGGGSGLTGVTADGTSKNLLNVNWALGSGSIGAFGQNGSATENVREWGETPYGGRGILWKAVPDAVSGADGGWGYSNIPIDHTKTYRLSVWVKKTGNTDGTTYFGTTQSETQILNLAGTGNSNPYFWASDLPELNKWYLLVAYVHGSGDTTTTSYGRIYDGTTGKAVVNMTDFKFPTSATVLTHRTYLYYNTNTTNRQYWWSPRVDEVNGDEPGIGGLLGELAETDPQVGTLTNAKWCTSDGTKVNCATDAPSFTDTNLTEAEVDAFANNNGYLNKSGGTMTGNTVVNNYGIGNVGLYSATRYQNVFAMGNAYKIAADGLSLGNSYGLVWTHSNIGGQSKAGLGHQLLLTMAGTTRTALGQGIWTAGSITSTPQGTLWGTANDGAGSGLDADLLDGVSSVNLFNNMGDAHSTRTSFAAQGSALSSDFGWRYVQGSTNSPGVNGATQYYSQNIGLGSDYAYNTYGMQLAYPRNVSSPYISVRYAENGVLGAWQKISAGYADSADKLDGLDLHTGRNNEANKVVRTDASGYIQAGWINSNRADQTTAAASYIYDSGDGYMRKKSLANARTELVTASDVLTKVKTVDGSGSGLDADLLDGVSSASFIRQVPMHESIALDDDSTLSTSRSRAIGYNSQATGIAAVTLGTSTYATGNYSTTIGLYSRASGESSMAMGRNTVASGSNSAAMGHYSTAAGNYAISMGTSSDATGEASVALGYQNDALGRAAVSLGFSNEATVNYSTAMGFNNLASGEFATVMGMNATAQSYASIVGGRYNVVAGSATGWGAVDPLFVLGNGTGTTARANAFEVKKDGSVYSAGALRHSSDARLKQDVKVVDGALEKLNKLEGVTFDWISENKPAGIQYGVIAQEVEKVFPDLVKDDSAGYKTVDYNGLVAPLIEAVKELKAEKDAEIEALKKEIEALKNQ